MSRVRCDQKFMNENHYDASMYQPKKKIRVHREGENYHKANTLSLWLFMKYDMSYKAYRRKSKSRRQSLRDEYLADITRDKCKITKAR